MGETAERQESAYRAAHVGLKSVVAVQALVIEADPNGHAHGSEHDCGDS